MAFLCRIRQARLTYLCSQFTRSYFQVSSPRLSDYVSQNKLPSSSNRRLIRGLPWRSNEGFDNVRFFAVPIQFQKKEEPKTQKGRRLNEKIKSHMVRLVDDEGHEIVPLHVALERAKRLNLDLVEVDHNATPIVCRIMDYHRERYQQQVRIKERSKSKAESSVRPGPAKEVRFSPKIEQKDLQMKADLAKRLMERGYRVKCMVIGSEEGLGALVDRLHALIEDVAFVENGPRVEKNQAYIVVRHIKFGPSKKGAKGASNSADAASSGHQKDTTSRSAGGLSGPIQHPADIVLRVSEDSVSDLQSTSEQDKMNWSLSEANGADEKVFDFGTDMVNADGVSDQKKKPLLESVAPNADFLPPQMSQVPNLFGSGANSSENRYSRQDPTRCGVNATDRYMQPGPGRAQMPQLPNFMGPSSNSSENKYSRQDPTRRGVNAADRFMQPGPGRAQMPQVPNFMESSANSSENRYSRQGTTGRSPPGAGLYMHPGPGSDPKSFSHPPRSETPKQNPSNSDCIPPSSNYGIFSNPNASLPGNHGFEAQVRPGNGGGSLFGSAKGQGLATQPANPDSPPADSSTGKTSRCGLFSGEGSQSNASRISQNQAKVVR